MPAPRAAPLSQPEPQLPTVASWLEVDAAALVHNVGVFRRLATAGARPLRLGAVVKANAYGHGLGAVLPLLHPRVDVLHVITPQDALEIRRLERVHGLPPRRVLVIGGADAQEAAALAEAGVELVIADERWAEILAALRHSPGLPPLRVHVHLDTGLGREGFVPASVPEVLAPLRASRELEVVGVLSHFANVEDVTEQTFAQEQLARFREGAALLESSLGIAGGQLERHFAASAAALVLPESRFDVLRVGIGLYGLWPSAETRLSARILDPDPPVLIPVLSWKCRAQVVKTIPAGSYVGYGCTHRCESDTRIAVLPVGYYDGYPRLLSSRAHVLVHGRRCPVLGRVMMNHVVVDVTRAAREDQPLVATLLGRDGSETVSAEALAGWAQTISYEIVARLGPHLRRVVVGG